MFVCRYFLRTDEILNIERQTHKKSNTSKSKTTLGGDPRKRDNNFILLEDPPSQILSWSSFFLIVSEV